MNNILFNESEKIKMKKREKPNYEVNYDTLMKSSDICQKYIILLNSIDVIEDKIGNQES
jgi:hypothetical protein